MDNDFFVDKSSVVENTTLKSNAKIYKECNVKNSSLQSGATVGDFSRISDSHFSENVRIQRNAMIYSSKIGRFSYTGKNFTAWHCDVGAFCSISWNVGIGGANHDYKRVTTHSFLYSSDFGILNKEQEIGYDRFKDECIIGNDVWIGANAFICRNVKIGSGAVVAAGAVVTKDVEPYTIVAGVPAKPIKKRFSDDVIALLLKSEWWNLPEAVIKENFELFNSEPNIKTAEKILNLKEEV